MSHSTEQCFIQLLSRRTGRQPFLVRAPPPHFMQFCFPSRSFTWHLFLSSESIPGSLASHLCGTNTFSSEVSSKYFRDEPFYLCVLMCKCTDHCCSRWQTFPAPCAPAPKLHLIPTQELSVAPRCCTYHCPPG